MKPLWAVYGAEAVGTLLLVAVGCSLVVFDFAPKGPVAHWIPDPGLRRALTGFLFGSVGGSIAVSRLGRVSGAHINPVVTIAFWLKGRMDAGRALGYVLAQLVGGVAGALPLLWWGRWGASVHFAATLPGPAGVWVAAAGEGLASMALVLALFQFVGRRRLRPFTPAIFPPLYAILVWLEAPLSGTSTNPARSLGPALVSGAWSGWWVDWLGPVCGLAAALAILRMLPELEIEVAKLYHFTHDPHRLFERVSRRVAFFE